MDAALLWSEEGEMPAKRKVVDPLEPERHRCARVEMSSNHSRDRGSAMNITTYALDLAKQVFQVHWVEPDTGEIRRKALLRAEVNAFFAQRPPGVVAMEACGSAHHWGRVLRGLGHEVRLVAAQFVRPFVKTNKTDAADAEAIWEASQRPGMRYVALKSEEQPAVLSLHRMRQQCIKVRTMQAHQVRGLLYEFGAVVPKGWRALLAQRPVDEAPLRSVRLALLISTRELDSRADLEFIRARLITESPALRAYNLRYLDDWARAIAEHVALRTHSKPTDPWPSLAGRCTMAAVIDARQRWVTEGGDSERRVRLVRTGLDLLIRLGTEFAPEKSR